MRALRIGIAAAGIALTVIVVDSCGIDAVGTRPFDGGTDAAADAAADVAADVAPGDGGSEASPTDGGGDADAGSITITMGVTTVLPTDDSGNGSLLVAQSATLAQAATLQSLSFYVTTAAGKLRLGVYDTATSGTAPGAKRAETAELTPVVGWNTALVTTPVALAPGKYWLAYLPSDSGLHFRLDPNGGNGHYAFTYGPMPATFASSFTTDSNRWSFYATLSVP